jgi:hypothetical protein
MSRKRDKFFADLMMTFLLLFALLAITLAMGGCATCDEECVENIQWRKAMILEERAQCRSPNYWHENTQTCRDSSVVPIW